MKATMSLRRFVQVALKQAHNFIPIPETAKLKLQDFIYSATGDFFANTLRYQQWKRASQKTFEFAFKIPTFDEPLVSIIIPCYGNLDVTSRCIWSIATNPPKQPFEVIVIEDASQDPEIDHLKNIEGLIFVKNTSNLGFLKTCNAASKLAKGKFLHFLNNDTVVTPGWLDALVTTFTSHPDCGLVGSKLIYPDGTLQEAGGIIWSDASGWNYGRHSDPDRPEFNYVREVDYCSGASLLIEKALFDQVDLFDELYVPAYCEDSDLAFKVRNAGRKVYYQPLSLVVHYEGVSHGTDESKGIKSLQRDNNRKLFYKWKDVLTSQHSNNGKNLFFARDRSLNRQTILIIDHYIPQPDRDAGSRTMGHWINFFVECGFNVKFWPQNLYRDKDYIIDLQQKGVEVFYGHYQTFSDWIRENGLNLDYVLLSRPEVAFSFMNDVKNFSPAKIMYYGHDVHHLRLKQMRYVQPSLRLDHEIRAMERLERYIWNNVDCIYYPSTDEADYIRDNGKHFNVNSTPAFIFKKTKNKIAESLCARSGIIFVAGFGHPPNVDAAQWFIREIFPLIQKSVPSVSIYLVGSNPTHEIEALANDKIIVTGYVSDDDLLQFYAGARVAIAPLRYGGGVKGKVIEAMAMDLPIVTTSVGAQGLAEAKELPICDLPEDFAAAVVELLENDSLWTEKSVAGQRFIEEHYSHEALKNSLAKDIVF